jgi:sarcosine oxidase delta subunit
LKKRKKEPNYLQGFFKPNNPEKYVGNVADIVFRSSYELEFLRRIDNNPDVLKYTSETIKIKYYNPLKQRWARYFVDIFMEVMENGKRVKYLVEIKPVNQITQPKHTKHKKFQTYLTEMATYSVNQAKWQAAKKWCDQHGCKFVVVTRDPKTHQFRTINIESLLVD